MAAGDVLLFNNILHRCEDIFTIPHASHRYHIVRVTCRYAVASPPTHVCTSYLVLPADMPMI